MPAKPLATKACVLSIPTKEIGILRAFPSETTYTKASSPLPSTTASIGIEVCFWIIEGIIWALPKSPVAIFLPCVLSFNSAWYSPEFTSAPCERFEIEAVKVVSGKASNLTFARSPMCKRVQSLSAIPTFITQSFAPEAFMKNTGVPGPASSPSFINFLTITPLAEA